MSEHHQDDIQQDGIETPEEVWVDADHSGETDDEWHRHTTAEGTPQHAHGETSPATIATVAAVSFLLLGVSIVFVVFYFVQINQIEYSRKVEVDLGADARSMKLKWEGELKNYGWIDPAENIVHIPIDRAIRSVAREYAQER